MYFCFFDYSFKQDSNVWHRARKLTLLIDKFISIIDSLPSHTRQANKLTEARKGSVACNNIHAKVLAVHNMYFVQYVFLLSEQAETYLKVCVLIYHLTFIFSQVVRLEGKHDFEENVIFKLYIFTV